MPEYYITTKEKDSIRFYQGDVRKRGEDGQISEDRKNEGFYGIHSAYKTLNCLLFPGIDNEVERIREKTAKLKPQILEEAEKSLEVYCDIYKAMCKFALSQEYGKIRKVYRTERGVSIKELKKGSLVSFTSTSLKDTAEDFLLKKGGLTFLELVVPCSVPHLDFREVLGNEYLYSDQEEILLPPFLSIEVKEIKMADEEQKKCGNIAGANMEKYFLFVKEGSHLSVQKRISCEGDETVLSKENNKKAAAILDKMNHLNDLTEQEIDYYSGWKESFRCAVMQEFNKINKEYFEKTEKEAFRKEMLFRDVKGMLQMTNKKREEYRKKLVRCNWWLAAFNILPIVCMTLSFLGKFEILLKVLAILFSTGLVLLTQFVKIEAYGAKLMQRSKTYHALCDLYREMQYEMNWNHECIDTFVQKYRSIMKEDTKMSLQGVQLQVESGEELFQDKVEIASGGKST